MLYRYHFLDTSTSSEMSLRLIWSYDDNWTGVIWVTYTCNYEVTVFCEKVLSRMYQSVWSKQFTCNEISFLPTWTILFEMLPLYLLHILFIWGNTILKDDESPWQSVSMVEKTKILRLTLSLASIHIYSQTDRPELTVLIQIRCFRWT